MEFLPFFRILYWDIRVHNFLSDVHYFLQTPLAFIPTKWKTWTNTKSRNTDQPLKCQQCFPIDDHEINPIDDGQELCFGELKMVMDRLGISYDPIGADDDKFGVEEFSTMFDDEEPCFEELEEAFGVFDVNQDGFIDATELQRVVISLGLVERSQVEECTRMISAFDENGDGLIDFNEFVKLIEKCC
ncbi:probable calcium-binding protein CML45 [Cornus florida]|uniref:probable calcium-binding protein CML45 n=1 Tax=Cornus florida TaxID=4283 RepID=UPI00289B46B2|nr:probable calcium-binding protein CML45 [Cornus florida]